MATTVYLKERSNKDNTRTTFYLEFYRGYVRTTSGSVKNIRTKTALKGLYKIVNPKNSNDRAHNKEHVQRANEKLKIVQSEIIQGIYSFKSKNNEGLLIETFNRYYESRDIKKNSLMGWKSTEKHLIDYIQSNWNIETFRVSDMNLEFVEGFIKFLNKDALKKTGELLSNNTKLSYYSLFRSFVSEMVRKKFIAENYCQQIKSFTLKDTMRQYLTLEELQKMALVDCTNKELKRAFLFSCFTGVRWSDIQKLIWREIEDIGTGGKLSFTQKKTDRVSHIDLTEQARAQLGKRQASEMKIFPRLTYTSYLNPVLQKWAFKSGVNKEITFHSARHTFATLQITYGTDIYTLSKILGHKNIATTQVYAKIIDKKKTDAMNVIPQIEVN